MSDRTNFLREELEKYQQDLRTAEGRERGRIVGMIDTLEKAIHEIDRLRVALDGCAATARGCISRYTGPEGREMAIEIAKAIEDLREEA
jgi:hypothetical protein